MSALFDAQDLEDLLKERVETQTAVTAERVVWGWLKPVLGLTERPAEISDEVYAAAVELGAIAVVNPAGLTYESEGEDERRGFTLMRRQEILEELRRSSGTGGSKPRGQFPAALCWPDAPRIGGTRVTEW